MAENKETAPSGGEKEEKKTPYQQIYTIENLKKLTAEMMQENDYDSKYRNLVLATMHTDPRAPPQDQDQEYTAEQLQDQPRYDPDKAMMSI